MRILFLAIIFTLTSCASTIQSRVTVFSITQSLSPGSVAVKAGQPEAEQSLEFQHYSRITEAALQAWGLAPNGEGEPRYVASLSLGVDEVEPDEDPFKTALIVQPVSRWPYSTSAVLVDGTNKRRQYRRVVGLVLSERASAQRLYEATAVSIGSCDSMTVVFEQMLAAIIQSFPQDSGTVRTVSIKGDSRC